MKINIKFDVKQKNEYLLEYGLTKNCLRSRHFMNFLQLQELLMIEIKNNT